jgi:hypothetical protein
MPAASGSEGSSCRPGRSRGPEPDPVVVLLIAMTGKSCRSGGSASRSQRVRQVCAGHECGDGRGGRRTRLNEAPLARLGKGAVDIEQNRKDIWHGRENRKRHAAIWSEIKKYCATGPKSPPGKWCGLLVRPFLGRCLARRPCDGPSDRPTHGQVWMRLKTVPQVRDGRDGRDSIREGWCGRVAKSCGWSEGGSGGQRPAARAAAVEAVSAGTDQDGAIGGRQPKGTGSSGQCEWGGSVAGGSGELRWTGSRR